MFKDLEHMLEVIPVLAEIDKAFLSQFNKYDPLMNQQANLFMQMGMENPALMKAGFQSYHSIMAKFNIDMSDVISRFSSGNINYSRAVKDFKGFTGKHYKDMFRAGAQSVGNPYYKDLGLDRRSLSFLNKARRAEMKYFKKFLQDVKNPYHKPRHNYSKRAGYYANSAKAQFFNGAVAGVGNKMDIFWRLGVPMEDHCDICPIYGSHGAYTWQTLPTVPRGGDTPCLFRCYCHLQFKPRTQPAKVKGGDPDRFGLPRGMGRGYPPAEVSKTPGQIVDKRGRRVTNAPEELQGQHNDLRGKLNKARQMIEVTKGQERLKWIKIRQELNDLIINMGKSYPDYRFLPTQAVKDLSATIRAVMKQGHVVVDNIAELVPGDEIIWVRGTESIRGVYIIRADGRNAFQYPGGEIILNDAYDVNFITGGKGLQNLMKKKAVKFYNAKANIHELRSAYDKVDDWLSYSSITGVESLKFLSDKLGYPVTANSIHNFIAKQRSLGLKLPSSISMHTKNGVWTKGREALHERIIKEFLKGGTAGKELLMTGGYSGSGKSSILDKLYKGWEKKYINVNSDNIKMALARADGHNLLGYRANQYHKEATAILEELYARAITQGKNVLYDGTMRNFDKQLKWLKMAKDAKFNVTGLYADMPMDQAIYRAVGRGMKPKGYEWKFGDDIRFVDPFLVLTQENLTMQTFTKLFGQFDDFYHYSTIAKDPFLINSKAMMGQQPTYTSAMKGASVVKIKKLGGGANESWKIEFDNGTVAVYKPKAGEYKNLRNGITDEYTREAIAYEVDRMLKLGMVPETIVMDIPIPRLVGGPGYEYVTLTQPSKGIGSFQVWKKGMGGDKMSLAQLAKIPLAEKQRMALLDIIIQQTDRHWGNFLFNGHTKKLVAIDNGLCLPVGSTEFKLAFPKDVAGTTISADLMKGLKNFYEHRESFQHIVRFSLGGVLPVEELNAIKSMFKRVKYLIDAAEFPMELNDFFMGSGDLDIF